MHEFSEAALHALADAGWTSERDVEPKLERWMKLLMRYGYTVFATAQNFLRLYGDIQVTEAHPQTEYDPRILDLRLDDVLIPYSRLAQWGAERLIGLELCYVADITDLHGGPPLPEALLVDTTNRFYWYREEMMLARVGLSAEEAIDSFVNGFTNMKRLS
jgi:hypothetical protein